MSNKQSSIEWLINCITEDQILKAKSLNEWLEIFEQAKAMHKEEIENAVSQGWDYNEDGYVRWMGEQYYKETFGGNNEQ